MPFNPLLDPFFVGPIILYCTSLYLMWAYVRIRFWNIEDRLLPKKIPIIPEKPKKELFAKKPKEVKLKPVFVKCADCGKKSEGDLRQCPYCKSIVLLNA